MDGHGLSLFMLDIDFLKTLNDENGHLGGNAALKWFARIVRSVIPKKNGMAYRFGGDEFAVLISGYEAEAALKVAEALRGRVNSSGCAYIGKTIRFTISVGVAHLVKGEDVDEIIDRG